MAKGLASFLVPTRLVFVSNLERLEVTKSLVVTHQVFIGLLGFGGFFELPAPARLNLSPERVDVVDEVRDEAELGQEVRNAVFGQRQTDAVDLEKDTK